MAVAKKGTKKAAKAAVDAPPAAKKEKAPKEAVDNFRKSEFVASIAEKTGMTKVDSETALNAVLDTISDVSACITMVFYPLCRIVLWSPVVCRNNLGLCFVPKLSSLQN